MRRIQKKLAIAALRWVLGVVLAGQAAVLLLGESAINSFARTGLPPAVRLALAWGEIVAALLFLIPATLRLGAWCLLVMLAGAILIHLAVGSLEIGGLVVDSVAVVVVLTHHAARSEQNVTVATEG
jgi:uncharacterized membrane protein YphA (DoxX/SURF4 family)